jgi:hypothetical protein
MATAVGFDDRGRLDELRCRPTSWLVERREVLVAEQRRLRVEELAVVAVLDERGVFDDSVAARDGVSTTSVRETVETARALEDLPEVAAVAHAGGLSTDQLTPLTRLADRESDAEWARRGPACAPVDLARLARTQRKPTAEEAHARRAARTLSWWHDNHGMLSIRGELPDVDGTLVESVLNRMVDRMRPARGEAWAPRAQRGADALVELCRNYADVDAVPATRAHFVVQVPLDGPAEVAGIPLPDSMVEALRATATIEPVLVDDVGVPVATGRARPVLSPKILRAVLLRDGHCRWPGCTRRTGLQVHHLWPRSWGGTDEIANLAAACVGGGTDHHTQLAPHGPYLLVGNPNQPDGLRLIRRDDLADLVPSARNSRAGPTAA